MVSVENLIWAIYESGPRPIAIARKLGLSVDQLNRLMTQYPEAVATYKAMLDEWIAAIEICGGDYPTIARRMGVRLSECRQVIAENPILREMMDLKAAEMVSDAIVQLRLAINRGEEWAVKLALLNTVAGAQAGFGKIVQTPIEHEAALIGQDPVATKEKLLRFLELMDDSESQ